MKQIDVINPRVEWNENGIFWNYSNTRYSISFASLKAKGIDLKKYKNISKIILNSDLNKMDNITLKHQNIKDIILKKSKTKHEYVVHSEKKYARKEIDHETGEVITISTNGIENIWSVVKRGLKGTYIRPTAKYMQEYLNEFQFRYNHKNQNIFIEMIKRIFFK